MFQDDKAYWIFRTEILTENRYCHSDKVKEFIDEFAKKLGNIEATIKTGSQFFRTQKGFDTRVDFQNGIFMDDVPTAFGKDRMKPLRFKACEGRLNPKGIPYLYLSNDKDTAIAETRPWIGEYVSVGIFQTTKDLKLVYFERKTANGVIYLKGVPKEKYDEIVLGNINSAFSTPVTNEDNTAEYVPTQILAERVRREGYDGIIYASNVGHGFNVALFNLSYAKLISCALHQVTELKIESQQVENPYVVDQSEKSK